jgi:aldose 1-epimerase
MKVAVPCLGVAVLALTPWVGAQAPATVKAPTVTRIDSTATLDGKPIEVYRLANGHGLEMEAMTYGGIIRALKVPDRSGAVADVVLGFDTPQGYLSDPPPPYFGALIGRYGNRIAKGHFTVDGQAYTLAINNAPNSLHGGNKGFDKVLWTATPAKTGASLVLTRTSPSGEEGFPGTLQARVTYTLTEQNELVIEYHATTDKATPVNLTQHSYFNLAGEGSGDILGHVLMIDADRFTPVDENLIPTGTLAPVANTPFDFRTPTAIGARIDQDNQQLKNGKGYDHNWVLNRKGAGLQLAARLTDPKSGRTLEIRTTEPGLQFYSGNFLDGTITGKAGHKYGHRSGLCLETQHYPDSPNQPTFPSTILRPGQSYDSKTVFAFTAK